MHPNVVMPRDGNPGESGGIRGESGDTERLMKLDNPIHLIGYLIGYGEDQSDGPVGLFAKLWLC